MIFGFKFKGRVIELWFRTQFGDLEFSDVINCAIRKVFVFEEKFITKQDEFNFN